MAIAMAGMVMVIAAKVGLNLVSIHAEAHELEPRGEKPVTAMPCSVA